MANRPHLKRPFCLLVMKIYAKLAHATRYTDKLIAIQTDKLSQRSWKSFKFLAPNLVKVCHFWEFNIEGGGAGPKMTKCDKGEGLNNYDF